MKIYLYIKTHNKTGLKYFGKTTKEPFAYTGSGKYWLRHLDKHGYDFSTEIFGCYDDIDVCEKDAVKFSLDNNIVESTKWANCIVENGKDGAPVGHPGHVFTDQELQKISGNSKKMWADPEFKNKMKKIHKDRMTDEVRWKCGNAFRGKKRPEHSAKMKGRKLPDHVIEMLKQPRDDSWKENISAALTGKPKSKEHIEKLSEPKRRICRLFDKKEMSINHYGRWIKTLAD